jgi:hypothetical protein
MNIDRLANQQRENSAGSRLISDSFGDTGTNTLG